jgi:thymidylate synthase (FAD)
MTASVKLIDMMGDEAFIVQVARLSHKSEGNPESDKRLLKQLVKRGHTTPLEFVQMVFDVDCPVFVERQLIRHRTGTFMEKSLRHTTEEPRFYMPDKWRGTVADQTQATILVQRTYDHISHCYRRLLEWGVVPEQARIVLPLATYTQLNWRVDAHNLINGFLRQRLDKAAQQETREYAQAVAEIVKDKLPVVWAATLAKWG